MQFSFLVISPVYLFYYDFCCVDCIASFRDWIFMRVLSGLRFQFLVSFDLGSGLCFGLVDLRKHVNKI